ncbi:MAG TPA: cyclopropane-fatty-acyl-phospholipid synthase family protein [Gammaproteobacteria bacterium]|nr:cyclopropane-fatty-acyl-phospholipid synthase family protein [Gammaproteobacteria bacterium]
MKKEKAVAFNMPAVTEGMPVPDFTEASARVSPLERWLARKTLSLLGDPPLQMVLWNGEEITTSSARPAARVALRHRSALYKLLSNPDLQFGDLYSVGSVEVEGDLVKFLEIAYGTSAAKFEFLRKFQSHVLNRPRANTLAGSSSNIHHHYDLSNDFYQLWLDQEMQYTCAYFPSPSMTLEEAQIAKLDHVCRKLQLRPGDRVVEAGSGWGGLARHMARHYGAKVRSFNISREQIRYARERAAAEGLSGIEYIEDDYRNITGQYDAFVSVGMLEHVGLDHYRELGEVIHRCLTPDGRGLIHSIGRNKPEPMNAWIEKRIFPGAYPPSLREMMEIFEPHAFSVLDVENLRLHYAKTLEHWLARFERHADTVQTMFDENFVRAWRLYLAGSLAGFTTGWLQLFQVVFARGDNNTLPWSRAHLYDA